MVAVIQTVGVIALAVFMVAVLVLATISKINERKHGRQRDDGGGGFGTDASRWGSGDSSTDSGDWGSF